MRIGELAAAAGVPATALRYYEQVGLLPPATRTGSGYREYDDGAVNRVRFLRAAQRVGFTLGEIREVLGLRDRGDQPCEHVVGLIHRHVSELDARIAELEEMRSELQVLDRRASRLDPRDCGADDVCHVIPG